MREKAYFKRYAQLHSKNKNKNYLKIYEALHNLPEFEKNYLSEKFSDSTIGKYLSSEVKYLEDQLMKSLISFHFDNSPKRKIHKHILHINLLMEKGFRERALKVLNKTKKLAYKFEDFHNILTLIQYEEEILFTEGILGFTEKLKNLKEERARVNAQIQNIVELRLIREQIREIQFSDGFITDTSKYPQFYENPFLNNESDALSLTAKDHFFYIRESRYYITRQYSKGQKASADYLNFMEQNEFLFTKGKILSTYSNYLYFNALLGDTSTFEPCVLKLKTLQKNKEYDYNYISFIIYTRSLELYYRKEEKDLSSKLLPEVINFFAENKKKMGATQINYLMLIIIRTYIFLRKTDEAIDWLHMWNQQGILKYTMIHYKLFSLILHIEKEWHDLLLNEIQSTTIILKNYKQYNELAIAYIRFCKTHLKNPENFSKQLIKLRTTLNEIKMDPEKNAHFEYFNFVQWADQMILINTEKFR